MALDSFISWTNHTYNPWRGCTKVGPACDFCFAEARDIKYESGKDATEGAHWGTGKPRIRAAQATLDLPFKITRMIEKGKIPADQNRVFTMSLGDFADKEVAPEWKRDLWDAIRATPKLRYQMVTKRVSLIDRDLPDDFEQNFKHVGFIVTAVTQKEVDRDLPRLMKLKKDRGVTWIGLSIEPQLELIELPTEPGLDWAILGGESWQITHAQLGTKPRQWNPAWAERAIAGSKKNRTAIYVKQSGARPIDMPWPRDGAGVDPRMWNDGIRVQDFPVALA